MEALVPGDALNRHGTIVVDEAHECNLNAMYNLSGARTHIHNASSYRPRVLAMSATMAKYDFSEFFARGSRRYQDLLGPSIATFEGGLRFPLKRILLKPIIAAKERAPALSRLLLRLHVFIPLDCGKPDSFLVFVPGPAEMQALEEEF
jgi:HrpA-like RNA helicase